MTPQLIVYYVGRAAQILGMWLLLVDLVTAGPMGPEARLFFIGVGVFVAGWLMTKVMKR